jgi:hypothetical protein
VVGEDSSPSDRARAWAAPEEPSIEPAGPAPMPTSAREPVRRAPVDAGRARPSLPVRLQPLTLGDLLDGAWSVITCRPQAVFGASALVLVPTVLLASVLVRTFGTSLDLVTALRVFFPYIHPGGRSLPGWPGAALAVAVLSLGTFVLGVAIARLVIGWYEGRELTATGAVIESLRRSPAVLGAFLILLVPKAVAIAAFLVPAWLVFPYLLLVGPVIAIEDVGPWRAIRRSAGLVGRRYLRVLAIWTIWLVVERVIDFALGLVVEVVAELTPDSVDAILVPAGWAFVVFVSAPAVAGMATLLYLDLRVRSEGMDLERDVAEAFAGA